jgi:hypothetical protein
LGLFIKIFFSKKSKLIPFKFNFFFYFFSFS